MRRIRPRSVYDVLALVSFFLVIGGGTALASYVVSSNSQVAPGTISGHKPPAGKHANIIGGSVNATDLANSAVSGGKLAPNSVDASKVADGSLTSADTDPTSIQHRVNGSCPSDQAAQSVTQDGSLNCGVTNGGTPGGSAGGDLAGSYPNPSLGSGVVGADALTPLGSASTDTTPVESVPLVITTRFSGTIPANSGVDDVIYNNNAPTSFQIIDAWAVYDSSSGCTCSWRLRDATGGGGTSLTPSKGVPGGGGSITPGTVDRVSFLNSPNVGFGGPQVIPAGGNLVLRVTNSVAGAESVAFDLHLLVQPVP